MPTLEFRMGDGGLALPAGAVDGFGQAADFYDSLGVNVHWKVGGGPYATPANVVTDLAALGIRHIRDTTVGSWYDTTYQYVRAGLIAVRNRNLALPQGEQPIFQLTFSAGWTGNQTFTDFTFTEEDYLDAFDGGRAHWLNQLNPRVEIANGTTSDPNAAVPNPWNHADAEVPWGCISAVAGPNEPTDTSIGTLRGWCETLYSKMKSRNMAAFDGLPVVTNQGIRTNVKVRQLPVVGPSVINNGQATTLGDWTAGTKPCEIGDRHPYHVGHEPSIEYATQFLNDTSMYNGSLRAGGADLSKTMPYVVTEWGHISRAADSAIAAKNAGAHAGYWPTPDDLIAEHMVRTMVVFYLKGIRRSYIYEFYDGWDSSTEAEANFGLLKFDRTKKHQFYALRNLLSLVGFSEATPKSAQQKLTISISGFTSTGNNNSLGKFLGAGDFGQTGDGQTYHQNADRLDTLQLQKSPTVWLLIITRQVKIWDREPGNWSAGNVVSLGDEATGRKSPNTQSLTVQLPSGVTEVRECTPTAGGIATPEDGRTYSAPLTINGSNQVTVSITARTKVLKIVKP